jgi:23S rRNA (uracil1939-C5)-methyltransferase
LELEIEKLIYGGDGLARLPPDARGRGKAVFVPFVLAGEKVDVSLHQQKRGFARGRAERILAASADRVEPRCPYFERCGGCHYQHASYPHQLAVKAAILRENLVRIAKLELQTELKLHASPPWQYRNRARLKVRTSPGFALGYHRFGSHELLEVEQCPISSPLINRALALLWLFGRSGGFAEVPDIREIELFANAEDTQLLIEVFGACGGAVDRAERLAASVGASVAEAVGTVVWMSSPSSGRLQPPAFGAPYAGEASLSYRTSHAGFEVSAGSFFQVNRHLVEPLVELATEGRSGGTALDLYAGVGLFAASLSRGFERVIAVESSPASHADLCRNATPNLKPVHSAVEGYLRNVAGKLRPDLIVVDPPRSGLGEDVVRDLVALGSPLLTYVSCDPSTLARDLGYLLRSGYRIREAHLMDLFPQTYHFETIFQLVR